MEQGLSRDAAVRDAQRLGIAEADPRSDLDGWDAAVKGCALANALMGASARPSQVRRRGIARVSPPEVRRALAAGFRTRLVVRGARARGRVRVSVAPERIPLGDPLSGSGPDAALFLETDLMGEIGVFERGATVDQTAYALLSDLLEIVRHRRSKGLTARSEAEGELQAGAPERGIDAQRRWIERRLDVGQGEAADDLAGVHDLGERDKGVTLRSPDVAHVEADADDPAKVRVQEASHVEAETARREVEGDEVVLREEHRVAAEREAREDEAAGVARGAQPCRAGRDAEAGPRAEVEPTWTGSTRGRRSSGGRWPPVRLGASDREVDGSFEGGGRRCRSCGSS